METDYLPKPKHEHIIGENLEAISFDELGFRIALLQQEIQRIEVERTRKHASRQAADSFFKS